MQMAWPSTLFIAESKDCTYTGETRKKGRNWVCQATDKLSMFYCENAKTLDHELGSSW